jgi:hypothetical protein
MRYRIVPLGGSHFREQNSSQSCSVAAGLDPLKNRINVNMFYKRFLPLRKYTLSILQRTRGIVVVKALCYKPEGRPF